jgi:hypothetical protein
MDKCFAVVTKMVLVITDRGLDYDRNLKIIKLVKIIKVL